MASKKPNKDASKLLWVGITLFGLTLGGAILSNLRLLRTVIQTASFALTQNIVNKLAEHGLLMTGLTISTIFVITALHYIQKQKR